MTGVLLTLTISVAQEVTLVSATVANAGITVRAYQTVYQFQGHVVTNGNQVQKPNARAAVIGGKVKNVISLDPASFKLENVLTRSLHKRSVKQLQLHLGFLTSRQVNWVDLANHVDVGGGQQRKVVSN